MPYIEVEEYFERSAWQLPSDEKKALFLSQYLQMI